MSGGKFRMLVRPSGHQTTAAVPDVIRIIRVHANKITDIGTNIQFPI